MKHMTLPKMIAAVSAGALLWTCVEKDPDLPVKGRRPLTQAEKERVKRNILKRPPAALTYRVNADLEGKVTYLGLVTPEPTITLGKPFTVIHYWQVKQAMPGWKLFVHTNGPGTSDFRNWDHHPVSGLHPVTKWKAGDIIQDRHTITLPRTVKYKKANLFVGIWRGGARLKVLSGKHDGKNRVLVASLLIGAAGPKPPPPSSVKITVRKARGKITLDGRDSEADWKTAESTPAFVHSLKGSPVKQTTTARLLWDDTHLYVFFKAVDDDVWATVTKPDDFKLWTEQAFEIFIDADGNGKEYIELQVNPRGAVFDAYLPRPGKPEADWSSGMKVKVVVSGTLNKRNDKDTGWQAEIAIPWAAINGRSKTTVVVPPKPGQTMRANLFRTDRPKNGALEAQAWSPPRRSTFHAVDRFGTLIFADQNGKAAAGPMKTGPAKPGPGKPMAPKRGRLSKRGSMKPGGMK